MFPDGVGYNEKKGRRVEDANNTTWKGGWEVRRGIGGIVCDEPHSIYKMCRLKDTPTF